MAIYNFQNQQVSTDASGNVQTVAPITSSTQNSSGSLSNVQTGTPTPPPNITQPVSTNQLTSGGLNFPTNSTPDTSAAFVNSLGGTPQQQGTATPNLDLALTGDLTKDPAYANALGKYNQSITDFQNQANTLPSQSSLLQNAQNQYNVPQNLQTVQQLTTQLAQLQAAFNNQSAAVETHGIQNGVPSVFYQGEQAAIARQQAVQAGSVATQLQAAQGNYQLAEQLAEKTANLQFADAQQKVNNMLQFIQLNQDVMTTAEKNAASKMQAQAVQLQIQLDTQKSMRTLALTAGVTKPFMNIGGTVIRTSDGKAFSTPQEAAAAGVDVNNWSNVQTVDPSKVSQKFQQVGVDDFGQAVYGFVNDATGTVTPVSPTTGHYTSTGNNLTSTNPDPSKLINGYDFTTYASDPAWGNKVNNILTKIPDLPTSSMSPQLNITDAQASILQDYITKVAPTSKITGQMIAQAAKQYGIDPKTLTAILQEESQFGTLGTGAKTFNPGNVGNTDSGATKNMGDWQSGVNAVAANMAQRSVKTGTGSQASQTAFAQYGLLANTNFKPTDTIDQLSQKYLDQYIKNGTVPTASTLGRNIKPQMMAQIDSRARDLYFQATGTALPNPEVIKGYQTMLKSNNQLANNLAIQEKTVGANIDLSLANMTKNGLNSSNFAPLNSFLDKVKLTFSDPATSQLIAQNATIQNELGSLLAVKNASGTTVYDKLSSAGIISSSDTPSQIKAKITALLQEANNFKTSIGSANADIYKQIDPLIQDPNNPIITMSKAKGFDYVGALADGHSYDEIISFLQGQ